MNTQEPFIDQKELKSLNEKAIMREELFMVSKDEARRIANESSRRAVDKLRNEINESILYIRENMLKTTTFWAVMGILIALCGVSFFTSFYYFSNRLDNFGRDIVTLHGSFVPTYVLPASGGEGLTEEGKKFLQKEIELANLIEKIVIEKKANNAIGIPRIIHNYYKNRDGDDRELINIMKRNDISMPALNAIMIASACELGIANTKYCNKDSK